MCAVHVYDVDDVDDDNGDVVKVRPNSTAPWNGFHEPIPQHRETNSTLYVEIGSRNKFHSTLQPSPRSRGLNL